ncbi:MAG: phage/plasmid primase, P4 family, partial [Planctomycetota bacterium]|nr:phage/plasmid primase, P4 family [Planctomycetota bacterium]
VREEREAGRQGEPDGDGPGGTDISVPRVAAEILRTNHFAVDAGALLYVFVSGVYVPRGERFVKAQVERIARLWDLSEKWSTYRANEVFEYIRIDSPELWERPPLETLNLTNGLLDLQSGQLRSHDPAFPPTVQLPIAFDPDADCPAWRKFGADVLPDDAPDLLWEILALVMLPITGRQCALLFIGEGENGKSVTISLITRFVGRSNCCSVSLHSLEADRFSAARLVGKLADLCADLPSAHLLGTSVFKQLTGEDRVPAERKHADPFDFDNFARLVFSCNLPPESGDATHASYRRWVCVPFTKCFEDNPRDKSETEAELTASHELSGALNMALSVLPRVSQVGLTVSPSMEAAWNEFRCVTDPAMVWLDGETVLDAEAVTPREALYAAYRAARRREGRPPMTETSFGKAVHRARTKCDRRQRTVNGEPKWCWIGLELRSRTQTDAVPSGHGVPQVR